VHIGKDPQHLPHRGGVCFLSVDQMCVTCDVRNHVVVVDRVDRSEAIRAVLGIAIISEWVTREDLRSGRLVRVLPRWNAKEFPAHVVYPGHRPLSDRVHALIDFAVKYMNTELHPGV
jgi:DNA-binding transcriptional LysR family regulator